MGLPTIAELEGSSERFVFQRGNKVRYFMDFRMWEGVPSDRIFYRVPARTGERSINLAASGYGVSGDYGSGSIFVDPADLPIAVEPSHD